MIKTFIAVSALALAGAASAETFTDNGITYTYTVAQVGQTTIITGKDSVRRPFQLRVNRNRVSGHFDGADVSFDAPNEQRKAVAPVLASR